MLKNKTKKKEQIFQHLSTVQPYPLFLHQETPAAFTGEAFGRLTQQHTALVLNLQYSKFSVTFPFLHKYIHVKFSVRLTFLLSSISCSNIALKTGDRATARKVNIKYNLILNF